jgi:hypothetical protein
MNCKENIITAYHEKKVSLAIFHGTGDLFPVIRNEYLNYS